MSVAKVFTKLTKRFIDARARRRKRKNVEEFVFVLQSDDVLHAMATKIQLAWRAHRNRKMWKGAIGKARALAVEQVSSEESDHGQGFMVDPESESKLTDEDDEDPADRAERDVMTHLRSSGVIAQQRGAAVPKIKLDRPGDAGAGDGDGDEAGGRDGDSGSDGFSDDSEERRERRRERRKRRREKRKRRDGGGGGAGRGERTGSAGGGSSYFDDDAEYDEDGRTIRTDDGTEGGRAVPALQPAEQRELKKLEEEEERDDGKDQPVMMRPEFLRIAQDANTDPVVRRAVEKLQGLVRVYFARKELRRLRVERDAREVYIDELELPKYALSAVVLQRWYRSCRMRLTGRRILRQLRNDRREERRQRLQELRARADEEDTDPEEEQRRMEKFIAETDAFELDTIEVAFSCFAGRGKTIQTAQIAPFLRTIGQEHETEEELEHITSEMDRDGRGEISFDDVVSWYRKRKTLFTPQALVAELLSMFDTDRNGFVNPRELRTVMAKLKEPITEEEAHAMVKQLDSEMNGQVSAADFRRVAFASI